MFDSDLEITNQKLKGLKLVDVTLQSGWLYCYFEKGDGLFENLVVRPILISCKPDNVSLGLEWRVQGGIKKAPIEQQMRDYEEQVKRK